MGENGITGRAALTPRTSFLVFMCLAAGAASPAPASTARIGELRSQERVIRGLMTEVDEQIEEVVTQLPPDLPIDRHAKMLARLRTEYSQKLAHLMRERREEETRQVAVSFSGLLDVHFDPTADRRASLTGVRFDRAVDDGGLEMLRFTSRDGHHTWTIDPATITGIRAADPADGAD